MLFNGEAELIFPLSGENRSTGGSWFFALLADPLVDFGCSHRKEQKILIAAANDFSQQFVAMRRVPAHERHNFCEEQATSDLSGLSLSVLAGTPGEGVFVILMARPYHQTLGARVDQELDIVNGR